MNNASILAGFTEYTPKEQAILNDMTRKFIRIFEKNGCENIDTPILEKASVLLAKSGGDTEKQVYRFEKGKNDIVMRYDLTVPLARYITMNRNDLSFPFKRYQLGKVYRGERNQRGRYREFYQLDVDVINNGDLSVVNDAWAISLMSQGFKEIGLKGYTFNISNRKLLKGLLMNLGVDNPLEVTRLIDRYDKLSRADFVGSLESMMDQEVAYELMKFIEQVGKPKDMLDLLSNVENQNETFKEGLEELKEVVLALKGLGVDDSEYVINLRIIRGLDYYTGTVFETFLVGNEDLGSICSGGRYDNLLSLYSSEKMPGVGISVGITRLFFVLKEIGYVDAYSIEDKNDYLIIPMGETFKECFAIRELLKNQSSSVDIYFESGSLKKKMKYANRRGVKFVIVVGENEVRDRIAQVKNMISGEVSNFIW